MSKESDFQASIRAELLRRFPGCLVLKNDPSLYRGIPDLLVIYKNKWVALECKRSATAHHQPNQDFYVDLLNTMSYASFIFPENREEVLNAVQHTFED